MARNRAPGPPAEHLYLVLRDDEQDEGLPDAGEFFERAIVYAASPAAARDLVCEYLALCNEAELTEPGEDEEVLPIHFERSAITAVTLATNVTRPDVEFDAEGILLLETGWVESE